MKKVIFILLSLFFPYRLVSQTESIFSQKLILMGVDFEIGIVHSSEEKANKLIEEVISEAIEIENTISSWKTNSTTTKINNNAGLRAIKVDTILFQLIKRSKNISLVTKGVFDISITPLIDLWKMDGSLTQLPNKAEIEKCKTKVNYDNIILNEKNQTIFLNQKGMKIGFGAIGKGFIAEHFKKKLLSKNIDSGIINAGGDITFWGNHPKDNYWKIAIANPIKGKPPISWLNLKNTAIVTSGNYEKFIYIDGEKYSHIINPNTGCPSKSLKSVTIICPNAELADALATSVFIMGEDKGIHFINQLKGIEAIIINDNNKIITTNNIDLNYE